MPLRFSMNMMTRWWFQIFFSYFHPETLGFHDPMLTVKNICSIGFLFNHERSLGIAGLTYQAQ